MGPSDKVTRRPTIGLLLDNLFDFYEDGFRRAIMQEAVAADVNLLCFRGGGAWGQQQGRAIYDLAGPENVDGIITASTCLNLVEHGSAPGSTEGGALEALLRGYAPLPIVSLGKLVRGNTSLLLENGAGVEALMEHFITVHGLQRIAFIRGPAHNEEADARFFAYRTALERHGFPCDPVRIFEGDFSEEAGTAAVKAFLDERHAELDAIIAANDYMAISAMRELQRRGLNVPGNVAVGGFDDVRHAVCTKPSLTTVRQPLREIARVAVEYVLAMIGGEAVPSVTRFPAEPVVRHSCGCVVKAAEVKSAGALASESDQSSGSARRAHLARRLEAGCPWVSDRLRTTSWAGELAGLLFDELERLSQGPFLATFGRLVARGLDLEITSTEWQVVVRTVFDTARGQVENHLLDRLAFLREQCLLLVGDLAEQCQIALKVKMEGEARFLQRAFRPTGVAQEGIWQPLRNELPQMGLSSFFWLRQLPDSPGKVTLEFHWSLDDSVVLDAPIAPFSPKRLLPGQFTRAHRYDFIIVPAQSGPEQMGFAVCGLGDVSGTALEMMVYQLASALKAAHEVGEVKRHVAELERKFGE